MPLPVRQIAYFVADIEAAALAHHSAYGSGPYFIGRHVRLAWSEHRGRPVRHDHSSAYGQWGDVMIEFVQQHGDDPSAFHDLFAPGSGRYGLHHLALWADNLDNAVAEFATRGQPLVQLSETAGGTRYAFVEGGGGSGHMIELYEPGGGIADFYAMVAAAARDWDGGDKLRELG
jgi:hypothetical protein